MWSITFIQDVSFVFGLSLGLSAFIVYLLAVYKISPSSRPDTPELTTQLRQQFPGIYSFLFPPFVPTPFWNRSEYLRVKKLLDQKIWLEAEMSAPRDSYLQSQIKEDARKLTYPVLKSRRTYKM